MKRDRVRFRSGKYLDDFELILMPFIIYNNGESTKMLTIGKFCQTQKYYLKCGSVWVSEINGDLPELIELLKKNIDSDFISKEDNDRILQVVQTIEEYGKKTEGESLFMDYIEEWETDIPDFEDTMTCSVCNKEFPSEYISTYMDKEKEMNICLSCEIENGKNTHSKYKPSNRANPKDAFDDDEQYIDWYENQ